jgi:hypothetical protein
MVVMLPMNGLYRCGVPPPVLRWRVVEVEGRDSFHPQKPMDKGMQKNSGGMEPGWNLLS